jgi:uncharacterized protein YneF (UPF0154 family)
VFFRVIVCVMVFWSVCLYVGLCVGVFVCEVVCRSVSWSGSLC